MPSWTIQDLQLDWASFIDNDLSQFTESYIGISDLPGPDILFCETGQLPLWKEETISQAIGLAAVDIVHQTGQGLQDQSQQQGGWSTQEHEGLPLRQPVHPDSKAAG